MEVEKEKLISQNGCKIIQVAGIQREINGHVAGNSLKKNGTSLIIMDT